MKKETWNKWELHQLAKEIMDLLLKEPKFVLSWEPSDFEATSYNEMPGIKFKVRGGLFHRGDVIIVLNEKKDFYEVFFHDYEGREKSHIKDIFFDFLLNIIDTQIMKSCLSEEELKRLFRDNIFRG